MGKKRRKGEQRQGICVYCGKAGLITDDHVFPKAIFHQLDQAMITVAACFPCNQIKSLGDGDLRNYIVMDLGGSQHPDAEAMAEKMLRESNVRLRAWLRKQITNAGEADLVTEDGILVGTAATFDFNMDRIMVAQELTVRGLFFHEKRLALPFDCPIDVQHVPWQAAPNLVRDLNTAAPTRIQTKGNNAVWWGYNSFDGGNEFDTIWQVCYNDWVLFLVATGRAALHMRGLRDAFRAIPSGHPRSAVGGREQIVVPRDLQGRPMIPPGSLQDSRLRATGNRLEQRNRRRTPFRESRPTHAVLGTIGQ